MDLAGIAALIVAIMGAIATATGGISVAWRWAKAQAKADLLREQSEATITAKNAELNDIRAENARLWALLQERSP